MIENIPHSVVRTIKACARDIVSSVKGGAYSASKVDDRLVTTIENFLLGMVANHYPRVKSAWVDPSIDASWTKKSAKESVVDPIKLQQALKDFYSDMPDGKLKNNKIFADTQVLMNMSEAEINKEWPDLLGGGVAGDAPMGAPKPSSLPPLPGGAEGGPKPLTPSPATTTPAALPGAPKPPTTPGKDEPAARVAPMKPGQVNPIPEDAQFEKGIPVK